MMHNLIQNCTADDYGKKLAELSINLLSNLTTAHRPCANLTLTGPMLGPCWHPSGASGDVQCPPEMVKPNAAGVWHTVP